MWLDPSFLRCRRGARNAPCWPLDGQRAGAASGRRRLRVDAVGLPDSPFRLLLGASPKSPQAWCRVRASQTSRSPTAGGEGARPTTQDAGGSCEDDRFTWTCRVSEASTVIRSVHPPARVHSRAHTRRHWPLPSGSNAVCQVASWNIQNLYICYARTPPSPTIYKSSNVRRRVNLSPRGG